MIGADRLAYPPNHIEADNRLSWMLGRLEERFGRDAYYVHLTRNREKVIDSFAARARSGIMKAYRDGILMRHGEAEDSHVREIAADYVDTVTANIRIFLRDKPNRMDFALENARQDWPRFWEWVGAEGDYEASLAEWNEQHNRRALPPSMTERLTRKLTAMLGE